MKKVLKRLLQRLFGLHFYLVLHGIFVVVTIRLRFNEGGVMQLIDRLREDCNVVDVGANVGAITVLFSRKCRRGHVYAFEPIPQNFRAAQTFLNVLHAGNVRLFDFGLGETEQTVEMVTPALDGVTLSGFSYVITDSRPRSPEGCVYSVQLVSLDGVSDVRRAHIDAIKIDVEGHEQFVLRGAREIISRDRPMIYCELSGTENRRNSRHFSRVGIRALRRDEPGALVL